MKNNQIVEVKKNEVANPFLEKWEAIKNDFIESIYVSSETKLLYGKGIMYFAKWLLENGIETPSQKDIVKYKKELVEKKELATANTYITILKRFYKWLSNNNLGVDITGEVKTEPINDDEDRKECLSRRQEKQLLKEVENDKMIYIATKMMLVCALRTIEISRMNCDSVSAVGDNDYILKIYGKGRKKADQSVPIDETFYNEINEYIGTLKNKKPSDPLFVSRSNNSIEKRITTSGIRKIMRQHFKNININNPRVSCHSLRKTCINNLVDISEKTGEINIFDIANYVRHSDVKITMKNYVDKKRKNVAKKKAMNLLNELYE